MASINIQNIPIDIHVNKLCDWLVSRHHCKKDWPEKIQSIRQKINEAIKDMPENATIAKILVSASPLNYYHCVRIVETLKETEIESKNFFGMYGSQRMKDWQDILKCYQKENLFMIESASILARNVTYEIPGLKRLISKSQQAQQECSKREASNIKQAQMYRDKFVHSCAQLHLSFADYDPKVPTCKPPSTAVICNQLVSMMIQELPKIFTRISEKSKSLKTACEFYISFLQSTIELTSQQEDECLPLIRFIIANGNATTYEFKNGEAPLSVELPKIHHEFEEENDSTVANDGEINFDDVGPTADEDEVQLETGEIDWGGMADNDECCEIDFSLDDNEVTASGITLEEDGLDGGVARGEDALSILENPETRNFFIDELVELEGFLSQRLEEVKHENPNEVLLSSQRESMSISALETHLRSTAEILSIFNEPKCKQFLLIRQSKRYIIRIAENLLQNIKLANKSEFVAEECKTKYEQLAQEIEQLTPKVQTLSKQSKELQAELTKEISSKYNNRQVYITGGF